MTTSSPELQFCLLQSEQSSWNRPHNEIFNVARRHVGRLAHSHLKSEDFCLEESGFKTLKRRIQTIRNNLVTTPSPHSNSSIRHPKVETKARSRSTSLQSPAEKLGRAQQENPGFTFSSGKKHWCVTLSACLYSVHVLRMHTLVSSLVVWALFWSSEGFEMIWVKSSVNTECKNMQICSGDIRDLTHNLPSTFP